MFKWLLKILFACFVFVIGFYIYTIRHPVGILASQSQYFSQRQLIYSLVTAEDFDQEAFQNFVISQADFKINDWPQEFWWSITFEDPRGDITTYQDILMAMALGIKRMYSLGEPRIEIDNAVNNILNRRTYVWHDFPSTNHYAREYAALAALAQTVGDTRYSIYRKKLNKSIEKLFSLDGYPLEGPAYGLYSLQLLAPYIYITGDQELRPVIANFHDWLQSVAALDGSWPLFEDSTARRLPVKLSHFDDVNNFFTDWRFDLPQEQVSDQVNETVWRRPSYTLWLRHPEKKILFNLHRHFSSLDLVMKSPAHWWLVTSGYPGYSRKFDRPYLQNIITHESFLENNWFWRVRELLSHRRPLVEKKSEEMWNFSLGTLDRKITVSDKGFTVADKDARPFQIYWNVKGELQDKQQSLEGYSFIFKQGSEELKINITGARELQLLSGQHSLNKKNIIDHTIIKVKGSKITSTFSIN